MLFQTPELVPAELDVIQRIERVREGLRHQLPEHRRWVGLLRRITLARAIRGSNSIEGYDVTLGDAVAAVAGEEPIDADREAWLAIVGYRDAMTYVLQLADDPYFSLNEALVRSLHFMMLKDAIDKSPGRWRHGPVFVLDENTSEIVYTAPDAVEIPELMHKFVEATSEPGSPAIVRAAMAHLNLVMIHPFRDGNGRMARCMQTLVLARDGVVSPPFASIEEYLGRNTDTYYRVLAEVGGGGWHPERDARPWVRFALTAQYIQAQTLVRRTEEAEARWEALSQEAARHGLPERSIPALFNAAMGFRITNPHYREAAGVNEHAAGRDLKTLVGAGLLQPVGERRGRSYVRTRRLQAIEESVRVKRLITSPFEPTTPTSGP